MMASRDIRKKDGPVSLPRIWVQEIKRMMTVYSMHCLFLTCTQKSHLYLHITQILNNYTMYSNFIALLEKQKGTPMYLEGQFLARGMPIHPGPCLVTAAPPLTLAPFHPFSHSSAHITLFTRTTSTITVFFVRDRSLK